MTVYTSSTSSPIVGDGGGKYYATYFFVNGPYNPNLQGKLDCRTGAFDDAVLPSVPLRRGERSQQHQQHPDRIPVDTVLAVRGKGTPFPLFFGQNTERNHEVPIHNRTLTDAASVAASAQVASHAPTSAAATIASRRRRRRCTVTGKAVAKVNGTVLTDKDLLREMYAIFPYARQHNGFPKAQEADIRQGALEMIIFEELVYQEALRRKMTIPRR